MTTLGGMTWLLTGGAGYIGGQIVAALGEADIPVVVLDDLSTGHRNHVPAEVPLIHASVCDHESVVSALWDYAITGVIHLAAKKAVEESVAQPLFYYRENVGGCESLLRAMAEVGVPMMVFSSSAAVYGSRGEVPISEDATLVPESVYGEAEGVCITMEMAQRRHS